MQVIDDRADPANRPTVSETDKRRKVGVLIERVVANVQLQTSLGIEWAHRRGIVTVNSILDSMELAPMARGQDRSNVARNG